MASARKLFDAFIEKVVPDIRKAFRDAISEVVDRVILKQVIEAVQAGDLELAFRLLGYSPAAMRPLSAAIERAYEQGGVTVGSTFPNVLNTPSGKAVFRFDTRNSRAEAWLRDKSSTLITNVGDDARANVQRAIQTGVAEGRNPRNIALDIVGRIDPATGKRTGGLIGLTDQQGDWVTNARARLVNLDADYFKMTLRDKRFDRTVSKAIADGRALPTETIDKLVDRYKNNALQYRGEMIARTEAIHSLNRSEWEATKQAIEMGATTDDAVTRHWDSAGDTRVRFSHALMDHQYHIKGVGIDEPFISPTGSRMLHPGDTSMGAPASEVVACRCRVRTKIDWLAAVGPAPKPSPVRVDLKALNANAKNHVLTNGRANGKEHLAAFNEIDGTVYDTASGKKNSVEISPALMRELNNPLNSIVVHHNHPQDTSLSPADIINGVNRPGNKGIWAHGNAGSSYYAEKGSSPASSDRLRSVWNAAQSNVMRAIAGNHIARDDASQIFAHLVNSIYHAQNHTKYSFELSDTMKAIVARNQKLFDQFIEAFRNV